VSVFRRRKRDEDPAVEDGALDGLEDSAEQDGDEDDEDEDEPVGAAAPRRPARPQGPWDSTDAPLNDDVGRIDLGGLLVPVPDGLEVRVDVSPEGEVVAATLVHLEAQMQINAFAAPRSEGIWAEVAREIQGALIESGGTADLVEGPYGPELKAAVPTEVPGQGLILAPARFVGIDGPRWFLRALLTGHAAVDAAAAAPLLDALKQVVVVRGGEAMAVRDPLPLRLPKEVAEQAEQASLEEEQQRERPDLSLPARGPEITEIQ
jgi:hypothetical protein